MSKVYRKISELIDEISMGPFGSDIKVEYFVDHGVPVLNGSNISGVKLKDGFKNYVTEERALNYKKAIARRGDIVITHRGTLGQIAYIPENSKFEKYVISQSQFRVKLKAKIVNPVYFAYYFHTNEGQKRLLSFKNHVGVPALAQATTNFRLLDFPMIPKLEQDSVAKFLKTIDDKIELNSHIKAKLEAMAKTLYDFWFVQFDFPDRNGKPYKSSGGEMEFNALLKRQIPKNWSDDSLWNAADFYNGLPMQKFRPVDDNFLRVIKIKEMNEGFSENSEMARIDIPPQAVVENGDILFSWSATLDVKIWSRGIGALNQHIFKVTSSKYSKNFIYFELLNYLTHFKMMADQRKTTMGHITQDHLKQSRIVLPPSDLIKRMDEYMKPIFEKHLTLEQENQQLTELRDWLLPMLMNGQVTVK